MEDIEALENVRVLKTKRRNYLHSLATRIRDSRNTKKRLHPVQGVGADVECSSGHIVPSRIDYHALVGEFGPVAELHLCCDPGGTCSCYVVTVHTSSNKLNLAIWKKPFPPTSDPIKYTEIDPAPSSAAFSSWKCVGVYRGNGGLIEAARGGCKTTGGNKLFLTFQPVPNSSEIVAFLYGACEFALQMVVPNLNKPERLSAAGATMLDDPQKIFFQWKPRDSSSNKVRTGECSHDMRKDPLADAAITCDVNGRTQVVAVHNIVHFCKPLKGQNGKETMGSWRESRPVCPISTFYRESGVVDSGKDLEPFICFETPEILPKEHYTCTVKDSQFHWVDLDSGVRRLVVGTLSVQNQICGPETSGSSGTIHLWDVQSATMLLQIPLECAHIDARPALSLFTASAKGKGYNSNLSSLGSGVPLSVNSSAGNGNKRRKLESNDPWHCVRVSLRIGVSGVCIRGVEKNPGGVCVFHVDAQYNKPSGFGGEEESKACPRWKLFPDTLKSHSLGSVAGKPPQWNRCSLALMSSGRIFAAKESSGDIAVFNEDQGSFQSYKFMPSRKEGSNADESSSASNANSMFSLKYLAVGREKFVAVFFSMSTETLMTICF